MRKRVNVSAPLLVASGLTLVGLGAYAGAYGYYMYANHIFKTYPEQYIFVCQKVIEMRQEEEERKGKKV